MKVVYLGIGERHIRLPAHRAERLADALETLSEGDVGHPAWGAAALVRGGIGVDRGPEPEDVRLHEGEALALVEALTVLIRSRTAGSELEELRRTLLQT
jgi:hypothetical protein